MNTVLLCRHADFRLLINGLLLHGLPTIVGFLYESNTFIILTIKEDYNRNIWIATDGSGLNKFNPQTEHFKCYNTKNTNLNKDAVLTVYIDSDENIWIGTWRGGFSLFNQRTNSFTPFTTENSNLSNNNVFDITEDQNGNLWLATQDGLNKFNKKNKSFTVYTQENSDILFDQIEVIKIV